MADSKPGALVTTVTAPAPAGAERRPRQAHLAALDGLRGIAVLSVVLFHTGQVQFGWAGVPFFFVLSGHFITRTLLAHADRGRLRRAGDFFRNRALRLAPLYLTFCAFVTVLAAVGYGKGEIGDDLPYLWTWTYDFRPLGSHFAPNDIVLFDHMWSLGIEVQFYLLWACVVLLMPRRWLVRTAVALALAGPLLRLGLELVLNATGYPAALRPLAVYVSPVTYLDAFAVGACTALPEIRNRIGGIAKAAVVLFAAVTAGLVLTSVLRGHGVPADLGYPILLQPFRGDIWQYSVMAFFAGAMVHYANQGRRVAGVLGTRGLARVGVISYCVYVAHVPILGFLGPHLPQGKAYSGAGLLDAAVIVACVLLFAELSYRFLEAPFLKLKRRSLAQSLAGDWAASVSGPLPGGEDPRPGGAQEEKAAPRP